MRRLLLFFILSLGGFALQAQTWSSVVYTVPYNNNPVFNCAVEDTLTQTLYLGGNFNGINQFISNGIIKFDGIYFDTLSTGLDDQFPGATATDVKAMTMFQNKLYVFGSFAKAGACYTKYMACWNGANWEMNDFRAKGPVKYADVYNNELYVAGTFDSIGGIAANCVAKYNGVSWSSLSHPVAGNSVCGLTNFKGKLYMAGQLAANQSAANISYYNGSSWVPFASVQGGVNRAIYGLKVIDTLLFVYGRFNNIAGTACKGIAAFSGTNWYGFGQGLNDSSWETIVNVQKVNGEIHVTGTFDMIEGIGNSIATQSLNTNVAKFDGEKWCLVSPPFSNTVNGIFKFKSNLFSIGAFKQVGPSQVYGFIEWNGGGFTPSCSPKINLTVSPVGIDEASNPGGPKVYPNPAKDRLVVEFAQGDIPTEKITIINPLGQVVLSFSDVVSKQEIDLSRLPQGVYYLKTENAYAQRMVSIIKE